MSKFGGENLNKTTNRGVEAKEVEVANITFDRNSNNCSGIGSLPAADSACGDSTRAGGGDAAPLNSSSSYVQVVVQQRVPGAEAGQRAPRSPRLPRASSPLRHVYVLNAATSGNVDWCGCGGGGGGGAHADTVLLVLPAQAFDAAAARGCVAGAVGGGEGSPPRAPLAGAAQPQPQPHPRGQPTLEKTHKPGSWRTWSDVTPTRFDHNENGPERVEVYYFEHDAGAFLATSEAGGGAGGVTACERWGRRAARLATRTLAPLPATAHLLLAAPLALTVTLERCALMVIRDLVTGVVQTASDYALKPALALLFNAVVRPPLVFAANLSRAVHAALRPLAAAATDAMEPAASLLRALRPVTVHLDRTEGRLRVLPDV